MLFDDLAEACGLKPGSINPGLSGLFREGLLEKSRVPTGQRGPGRAKDTTYKLNEAGMKVAEVVILDGANPLT